MLSCFLSSIIRRAKRKFLTIVLSSQGDWRKAINKKVLIIAEIK